MLSPRSCSRLSGIMICNDTPITRHMPLNRCIKSLLSWPNKSSLMIAASTARDLHRRHLNCLRRKAMKNASVAPTFEIKGFFLWGGDHKAKPGTWNLKTFFFFFFVLSCLLVCEIFREMTFWTRFVHTKKNSRDFVTSADLSCRFQISNRKLESRKADSVQSLLKLGVCQSLRPFTCYWCQRLECCSQYFGGSTDSRIPKDEHFITVSCRNIAVILEGKSFPQPPR